MPKKKKVGSDIQHTETEEFIVVSKVDDKKEAKEPEFSVEQETQRRLTHAMKTYDITAKQSSAYLEEKGSYTTPTQEELDRLAESPQDNIDKILRINSIISKYTNLDDIIGTVVEAIRINLNDEYRLSYKSVDGRNNNKKLDRIKEAVESFNEDVSLQYMIREYIPRAYMEGTVIMYLRKSDTGWGISTFPLGVAQISPYSVLNDPVILIDMNELKSRLNKVRYRTRSGKNLFFDSIEQEVKDNFPSEVYEAYINKEPFARLDIRYSAALRVGNYGKRYGVSPILKAIPSSLILSSFQNSDMKNAKARSKKIIYQLLDPKLLGENGEKNPLQQQAFAHSELVAAFTREGSVLYTAPAYVKSVGILESSGTMVDKDTKSHYSLKEMNALGIGFLQTQSNASISSAKISLEQLMRNINSIGKNYEEIIVKFYRQMLTDEGLDPKYAPNIKIIDSEALDYDLRTKMADVLYSKLNGSLRTAMDVLGYDFDDEVIRRRQENSDGIHEEFFPRATSYNAPSDKETGRPANEEKTDKTGYDEEYNKSRN